MTALLLRQIACEELADIGIVPKRRKLGEGEAIRWSAELPGFGVRAYASGRRMYVVQARMGGKDRLITLCNVRLLSRRQACDLARRIILRAQCDENPAETRQKARSTLTFKAFLDLYWQRMAPKWKPSTLLAHDKYRRLHLDKAFGCRGIDKITHADVARWFAQSAERGGQGGANRTMEILRAAFNRAEAWGFIQTGHNPVNGIKPYRRQSRARFLRPDELSRVGAALRDAADTHPLHVAALLLLFLTGCRSAEIVGLVWSEVVGSRIKLTDSKTGPRTVWLGCEAHQLLDAVPQVDGRPEVFWDQRRNRVLDLAPFWRSFRAKAGFPGLRIHDLRHSFASHGAALSETLPMIGKLLGHASIRSTALYAHLDDADLVAEAEKVGRILRVMTGYAPAAVIALASDTETEARR